MKHIVTFVILFLFAFAGIARAEKTVDEYGDDTAGFVEQVAPGEQIAPKKVVKKNKVEESDVIVKPSNKAIEKDVEVEEEVVPDSKPSSDGFKAKVGDFFQKADTTIGREGSFRAGFAGPGLYAGGGGIAAMMSLGLEGEYYFFERLSAGLGANVATDFSKGSGPNTILGFVPFARYVFDLDRFPRVAIYAQAGAGLALVDGKTAAADITIPAGGVWWQWTPKLSVGAHTALHILARSSVTAAFEISPTIRYQF